MDKTEMTVNFNPEDLERAGKVLYGDQWQSNLARDLGVDSRRVREWAQGERKPRLGVFQDIVSLLEKNRDTAAETAGYIKGKYF